METINGFKAFDKGMKCKDFQFEEGKTYEMPDPENLKVCEKGFHLCQNPLDCLDYYDLCESEFAEVEAIGKTEKHIENGKEKDSKIATTKIRIGAKISLKSFVEATVSFVLSTCKTKNDNAAAGDSSQLAASGDFSKLAASGDSSKLAAAGYSSQLAASGDSSKLAAAGYSSQLAASGDSSQLAAAGDSSKLAAAGYFSQLAAAGDSSQLAAAGDSSKLAASGDSSKLAASGYSSKLAAAGYSSQLAASGDSSKLAASGYSSKLAAAGDSSQLELNGNDSVGAGVGIDNKIKGKKGNWITLAEWVYDKKKERYVPVCVKSAQIDGAKIKEDTWYVLQDGEFKEICLDGKKESK